MSDDKVLVSRELLERIAGISAPRSNNTRTADMYQLQDELRRAQPSDGALTNEGAEPVAWTYKEYVWASGIQHHLWRDQLEREQPEASRNIKDLEPLYRHPPKVCTCPSGDGSLRWPCPVHPPEVKVVLPERKQIDPYSYDQGGNSKAEGWNACLDRVKELNS